MSVTFSSVSSPSALKATKAANNIAYAQFGSAHDTVSVRFGQGKKEAKPVDANAQSIGVRLGNYFKLRRNEEGKIPFWNGAAQVLFPWNIRNVYQNIVWAGILLATVVGAPLAPLVPIVGLLAALIFKKEMGPKALEETNNPPPASLDPKSPEGMLFAVVAQGGKIVGNTIQLVSADSIGSLVKLAELFEAAKEANIEKLTATQQAALLTALKNDAETKAVYEKTVASVKTLLASDELFKRVDQIKAAPASQDEEAKPVVGSKEQLEGILASVKPYLDLTYEQALDKLAELAKAKPNDAAGNEEATGEAGTTDGKK